MEHFVQKRHALKRYLRTLPKRAIWHRNRASMCRILGLRLHHNWQVGGGHRSGHPAFGRALAESTDVTTTGKHECKGLDTFWIRCPPPRPSLVSMPDNLAEGPQTPSWQYGELVHWGPANSTTRSASAAHTPVRLLTELSCWYERQWVVELLLSRSARIATDAAE